MVSHASFFSASWSGNSFSNISFFLLRQVFIWRTVFSFFFFWCLLYFENPSLWIFHEQLHFCLLQTAVNSQCKSQRKGPLGWNTLTRALCHTCFYYIYCGILKCTVHLKTSTIINLFLRLALMGLFPFTAIWRFFILI